MENEEVGVGVEDVIVPTSIRMEFSTLTIAPPSFDGLRARLPATSDA